MGRRSARHKFLPDMFVFPGGRLDAGDFAAATGEYRGDVAERLARHVDRRVARALGAAALRETHEEAGLRVRGLEGLDYLARAITPSRSPIRFHGRFFMADASTAEGGLGGSGELLDLAFRPIDASLSLPIADITEFILGEIGRLLTASSPERRALFWHYRKDKRIISHD